MIDAKGHTTTVQYDQLGRRTVINNPDTGRVETVYDPASNPVRKITARLVELNKAGSAKADHIAYRYDHKPEIQDRDGKLRYNVQIHIGAGCSDACQLIPGGGKKRDEVMNRIKEMQAQDKNSGYSDKMTVKVDELPSVEHLLTIPDFR